MRKLSIIAVVSCLVGFNKAANTCWSIAEGYPCCENTCKSITSDGKWGVENGDWCGIDEVKCSEQKNNCWSLPEYQCCASDNVVLTDEKGREWGVENGEWCGINKKTETTQPQPTQSAQPIQTSQPEPSSPMQFFLPSEDSNQLSERDKPAIEVYLPKKDKATGCAVVLCPGGGMRALSWDHDVVTMASFLNAHGIAAIGLRYHLNTAGAQGQMPPTVDVTHPDNFPQADANPLHDEHGDYIINMAAKDGRAAIRMIREHADEWNIDKKKIGYLGFSAGGGVAIAATMTTQDNSERPDFVITNFGPSLMPVTVPANAPPLLIMSRVEHPNVAAGLVALFMEWKKAGANAELHLYGDGSGPYVLMEETGQTTTENWSRQSISWLKAKGFIPKDISF